jgi:hypothetical protein
LTSGISSVKVETSGCSRSVDLLLGLTTIKTLSYSGFKNDTQSVLNTTESI